MRSSLLPSPDGSLYNLGEGVLFMESVQKGLFIYYAIVVRGWISNLEFIVKRTCIGILHVLL